MCAAACLQVPMYPVTEGRGRCTIARVRESLYSTLTHEISFPVIGFVDNWNDD